MLKNLTQVVWCEYRTQFSPKPFAMLHCIHQQTSSIDVMAESWKLNKKTKTTINCYNIAKRIKSIKHASLNFSLINSVHIKFCCYFSCMQHVFLHCQPTEKTNRPATIFFWWFLVRFLETMIRIKVVNSFWRSLFWRTFSSYCWWDFLPLTLLLPFVVLILVWCAMCHVIMFKNDKGDVEKKN